MDLTGLTWAVGALITGMLALFGYIWQTNNSTQKSIAELKELNQKCLGELKDEVAKVSERVAVQETMMEPLCEITKAAVPKILKLHNSPDLLEEALYGELDEEKLCVAEGRVKQELDSDPPTDRLLPLALAQWLLGLRRKQLEKMRKQ